MTRMLGQRAVVVGASVAGLLASRTLSEHFDEVVVLDSDEIEDGPVVHKSFRRAITFMHYCRAA